jgi:ribosomal protein L37AE/L43A
MLKEKLVLKEISKKCSCEICKKKITKNAYSDKKEKYWVCVDCYKKYKKDFKTSFKLLTDLRNELRKFKYIAGNSELVKKQGEKVLKIIEAVQKTEIYGFIKIDVLFIKEKVEYIVKHPKENKLAYFLATVYIIAPLTFEMTGAILFFRYLGKYSISKGKMIRERFAR